MNEESLDPVKIQVSIAELVRLLDRFVRPLQNSKAPKDLSDFVSYYIDVLERYGKNDAVGKLGSEEFYVLANEVASASYAIGRHPYFSQLSQYPDDKAEILKLAKEVSEQLSNRHVSITQRSLPDPELIAAKRWVPIEERLEEAAKQIAALQQVADSSISRTIEAERSVNELGSRIEAKYSALVQEAESRFLAYANEIDSQGKSLLKSHSEAQYFLVEKLQAVDDLISKAGAKALSGGYMRVALREELLANKYRTAAFVLMIVVTLYVVATVVHAEWFMLETERALTRGMGALFLSFAIGYLIRQSAVHRRQQHKYEQTALDLKAVDPFVANLPEEARNSVKQQIAEKVFLPKEALAAESGGFGAQEMLEKLIDKVEWPKAK